MNMEHVNWLEFALQMAEAGRAKVVEDRVRLAEILARQNGDPEITSAPCDYNSCNRK